MSLLEQLQAWYMGECNDDWEHSFGIKIETLDNPGWLVTIDLSETNWADLKVERTINERTETNWLQFEVLEQKFIGCGGPYNLEEILRAFFEIAQPFRSR